MLALEIRNSMANHLFQFPVFGAALVFSNIAKLIQQFPGDPQRKPA